MPVGSSGLSTAAGSPPLRRRMHILERAHSEFQTRTSKQDQSEISSPTQAEETPHSSILTDEEIESLSESEYEVSAHDADEHTERHERFQHHYDSSAQREATRNKAWYELDFFVFVALASPIGNWLTGGDYVKNILLALLLVFYLHQVIEVPWRLYLSSRPRKRPLESSAASEHTSSEDKFCSELRSFELFFLTLTALSPFAGAYLLRVVIQATTGEDIVSWFSTGLFVLATGIRPWTHLVDRLAGRISELHDMIHYPTASAALYDEVADLKRRIEKLDMKLKRRSNEMYQYVDEAVDIVENTVKRHEKRFDKYDHRLKDVEVRTVKPRRSLPKMTIETKTSSHFLQILSSWFYLSSSPSTSPRHSSVRSGHSHLETIPEEKSSVPAPSPSSAFHLPYLLLHPVYIVLQPLKLFLWFCGISK